jgi:hypothetical protein
MKQQLIQGKKQKNTKKIFKVITGTSSIFGQKHVQAIGEEIDTIKKKTPQNVVKLAQNPNTTLHKFFDWDNNSAGYKYRLEQARHILRSVYIVSVVNGEEIEERAYFNVINENKEQIYVAQVEAFNNPSYKKQLLDDMKKEVERLLGLIKLFMSL